MAGFIFGGSPCGLPVEQTIFMLRYPPSSRAIQFGSIVVVLSACLFFHSWIMVGWFLTY